MASACQQKKSYSAFFFSLRPCRYKQGLSGRATKIKCAQEADYVVCTLALHALLARPNFQARSTNQRSVAKDARVEEVNQDRFDAGISVPYKEISFS